MSITSTTSGPEDYRSPSDSILTFSPGTTSVPVSIPIVDDDIVEELENFFASLTLISSEEDSIQIRPDGAEIFITDNDGKLGYQVRLLFLSTSK